MPPRVRGATCVLGALHRSRRRPPRVWGASVTPAGAHVPGMRQGGVWECVWGGEGVAAASYLPPCNRHHPAASANHAQLAPGQLRSMTHFSLISWSGLKLMGFLVTGGGAASL